MSLLFQRGYSLTKRCVRLISFDTRSRLDFTQFAQILSSAFGSAGCACPRLRRESRGPAKFREHRAYVDAIER